MSATGRGACDHLLQVGDERPGRWFPHFRVERAAERLLIVLGRCGINGWGIEPGTVRGRMRKNGSEFRG
jgi:hypothetical protein